MEDIFFVNQTRFSEIIEKSKQYVSQLKRENKLIYSKKNKRLIDVKETLKSLDRNSDPSKKKIDYYKNFLNKYNIIDEEYLDNEFKGEDESLYPDIKISRQKKEHYSALLAETVYQKNCKILIEAELVNKQWFRVSRLLRDKLLNMPDKVCSKLSIMDDSKAISIFLKEEINLILNSIAEDIQRQIDDIEKESNNDQ